MILRWIPQAKRYINHDFSDVEKETFLCDQAWEQLYNAVCLRNQNKTKSHKYQHFVHKETTVQSKQINNNQNERIS